MTPNIFIVILLVLWVVSHSSYLKDSYVIFDKFHLNDIFSLYQKQLFTKTCTIQDGPNCYQISTSDQYHQSPEVKEAIDYFDNRIGIDALSEYMSNVVRSFREEHKSSTVLSQVVSMNLLLTFESYDEATSKGYIMYMPEEKVIRFKVGFIKLAFIGNLRLRNLNEKNAKDKKVVEPQLTFGVIEGKELIIKFDKSMTFNYVYIRPQEGKSNKKISIVGYSKDDKEIYRITETIIQNDRKWIKVLGKESIQIDYIKFPGEIEIDNLSLTELKETEDLFEYNNIQKKMEKVVNEYLRQNKEGNHKEGIQIIDIDDL